ncbi:hypothetical protein SARC_06103 [Sphaeroforma arctica JP610]|uniref:UME domain-containing protein n=1 Tax=Sphaeroforma arctica JP610 TaxID=667725 RepID=A0A0L0FY89_9EUKA|nr:hypothetical protein SARC_06103 [Sphaeroforma arctica JP610]KNC81584.1 hypothetical protein SARC_06103 [Sphaeroforma arctica JP610]|eukprot:XP_014155486.1 hypothetical protein SARC_06103 [Sphaeroforma arctica JP610]
MYSCTCLLRYLFSPSQFDLSSAIGVDTQPTPTPAAEISDEQLSVFLQQHLLAILTWLNGQLLSGAVVSRTRTMTAFARLLALIDGKYLYMVRGKVLGLLRLGLSSDVLVVSTLEAWRVFLRKLSFEQVHVILNESVFMLVSVLEDHEDSVAELLNLLIYDDDNTSEPGTQPNPSPHVHAHTTDTDTNQHEGQSPKNVTIDTRERAAHSRDALYVQLYILPQHPALERCRGVVERAIARLSFEDFLVQVCAYV